MAKGTSSRGSAKSTPLTPSLDTLLTPQQAVLDVQAMWNANAEQLAKQARQHASMYRPPNPEWDRQTSKTIADRRRYNPTKTIARPHSLVRDATDLVNDIRGIRQSFRIPNLVTLCVKRKMRREVLHALKLKPKRGRGRGKPRRRNFWSSIKC